MQHIEKTQQQWSQKYNTVIKERDNVRNELDLKQLEVINLREKLRDLKFRTVNPNDSFLPNASKDFSLSQSFRNKRISNPIVATQKLDVSSQTEDNSINVSATSSELCK